MTIPFSLIYPSILAPISLILEHLKPFGNYMYIYICFSNWFWCARKKIGHFTLMVSDHVFRIGCAAVRFRDLAYTKLILTCNYDYTNVWDEPVYTTGPTASQCSNGVDEKYTSLCKWPETDEENSHDEGKEST